MVKFRIDLFRPEMREASPQNYDVGNESYRENDLERDEDTRERRAFYQNEYDPVQKRAQPV